MGAKKFEVDINDFIKLLEKFKNIQEVANYYNRDKSTIYRFAKNNNIDINQYIERKLPPNTFLPNKEHFIEMYDKFKNSEDMAKYFNVCVTSILKYAKRIGYINHYRAEPTKEQQDYICSQYYNKTSNDLAKELNVSKGYITKIWMINGLSGKPKKTYYCNDEYFNTIDTFGKAYMLGMIASDGCVYKRKNHIGLLSLNFNKQEYELLNIAKRELNSNQPILHVGDMITLAINSEIIFNDLSKYNIVPRKTWIYKPVDLPTNELTWHYLRGYLDGDGSIYYVKNNPNILSNWQINFCGNKQTMVYIYNFLTSNNIKSIINEDNRDGKYTHNFYRVDIYTIEDIKNCINKLYLNSEGIRGRKYYKAMQFIEIYKQMLGSSGK